MNIQHPVTVTELLEKIARKVVKNGNVMIKGNLKKIVMTQIVTVIVPKINVARRRRVRALIKEINQMMDYLRNKRAELFLKLLSRPVKMKVIVILRLLVVMKVAVIVVVVEEKVEELLLMILIDLGPVLGRNQDREKVVEVVLDQDRVLGQSQDHVLGQSLDHVPNLDHDRVLDQEVQDHVPGRIQRIDREVVRDRKVVQGVIQSLKVVRDLVLDQRIQDRLVLQRIKVHHQQQQEVIRRIACCVFFLF